MKKLFLLLFVWMIVACTTAPKVSIVNQSNVKDVPAPTPESKTKQTPSMREQKLTFTDIIQKEGIPTENILPEDKEQLSIYQKKEVFTVYYFRENKLLSKKEFSKEEMEELKNNEEYPQSLLRILDTH